MQSEPKPTRPSDDDPRRERRVLEAVARVAPGTELRQGIDDIIRSHEGALIVIGHPDALSFLYSGGIRLDQPFTPQLLYELAKMDGAIIVNEACTRLAYANVQLMPDPTIPSSETGTRHRTAERVAKQTTALVVSISQQRETVTLFAGRERYLLDPIATVLAKTNQALAALETSGRQLARVPCPLEHLAPASERDQTGRDRHGRTRCDRPRLAARARSGRGSRRGARPRDPGGAPPPSGAQPRRPLPEPVAVTRAPPRLSGPFHLARVR
jgi:DisA bacterial checkpoint controller nucleotide-binding